MANSKELLNDLFRKIRLNESAEEIRSILYLVFHHVFGLTKTDVIAGKEIANVDHIRLADIISRLNRNEPVQYVLGEASFCGRRFLVNSNVLIPRPETEQLVAETLHHAHRSASDNKTILDVGTGSGCIAISLALELPLWNIMGIDVSESALTVARSNASFHEARVELKLHDILQERLPLEAADIIVSNPPYITPVEKEQMQKMVLDYEPSLALFVPQDDPLVFYKAIARVAARILTRDGKIFVEISERFGPEVMKIFSDAGFTAVSLKKDFSEKDRIVVASR